jgi:hypothetical protein
MSLPLKRKRESLSEPSGAIAGDSNSLERRENISGGRTRGRGRNRGRARGRSFHIPRHASRNAILTELWKHRTQGTFTNIPSQFGPVPPPPPTDDPNINLGKQSPHRVIAETPQLLHSPNWSNELGEFHNSPDHQNASSTCLRKGHLLSGPPKQIHRSKRQNQASTWTESNDPPAP